MHSKFWPKKLRLCQRQEKLVLTKMGWSIIVLTGILSMTLLLSNLYPFLAINQPLAQADALVVEGWLPDYAIELALQEFQNGNYQKLITTGVTVEKGFYLTEYKNYAELTAATFRKLGFNPHQLIAIPAPSVVKNRTYATALAVKDWLADNDKKITAINLYSQGPHARRSWIIFQETLSPHVKVGVINGYSQEYEAQYWWKSSAGFRTVIGEAIAYFYVRFIDWKS